ncbi:MAG: hypothetical protein H0W73_20155 [Bacteroidetes bacterium]|nr:hypothetical protein [Bacteroidota bacterium]
MQKLYILVFLLFSFCLRAQDKLFLKNGTLKKAFIVSIAVDVVYYKNSDTSLQTFQIPKSELILIENYKGDVFIYSRKKSKQIKDTTQAHVFKQNAICIQPLGIFVGRVTLIYERFTKDNRIGFVFPLSLTFDPSGKLYNSGIDTTNNGPARLSGVNFIGGLDVNFYMGRFNTPKFFVGPRIRYGTDMFMAGIEAYSIQTQFGWKYGKPHKPFIQHLSFGFGMVRILSSPAGARISPKQSYPWFSMNYSLGIKW